MSRIASTSIRFLAIVALVSAGISIKQLSAVTVASEWLMPISGSWNDTFNWSTSPVFPNNDTPSMGDSYDVMISQVGTPYSVLLTDEVSISSLTIDSEDATVAMGNSRLETPVIELTAGTLMLGVETPSGSGLEAEIIGANIIGNGSLEISDEREATPVLNGVTLGVDLVVPASGGSPSQPRLMLRNGLTIEENHVLSIQGSQTLSGSGEIVFEDSSSIFLSGEMQLTVNSTLTIGPDFSIRALTMGGHVGSFSNSGFPSSNIAVVNQGLLSGEVELRPLHIANVDTADGATFQNNGIVQAINSGEVIVGGNWVNNGVFKIRDVGKLYLAGDFSPEDIGTIDRQGGELYISGTVQNAGETLLASVDTGDLILGQSGSLFSTPKKLKEGLLMRQMEQSGFFVVGNCPM